MSEVIGHDCDGKPVRVGDRVVFIGGENPSHDRWTGLVFTVLKYVQSPNGDPGAVLDKQLVPNRPTCAPLRFLRVLPRLGSWDELEKEVEWRPSRKGIGVSIEMQTDDGEWVEL